MSFRSMINIIDHLCTNVFFAEHGLEGLQRILMSTTVEIAANDWTYPLYRGRKSIIGFQKSRAILARRFCLVDLK